MRVTFYTVAPSPHLVGLLNALHSHPAVDLHVVYERPSLANRSWGAPRGQATHTVLDSHNLFGKGLFWDPTIRKVAAQIPTDLAVVATSFISPNTHLLSFTSRRRGVPYVIFGERVSRISPSFVKRLRRPLVKLLLKGASGLVGVTQQTIRSYRKLFGYGGPATWVPYHRELKPFLDLPISDEPPKKVSFLVIGSLIHRKAVDVALRAFSQVRGLAEIIIAGDGPQRESLYALKSRLDEGRARFIGPVPYDEVPRLMDQADVLLFPSRHDGFGMVTMEALAAGVPVIGSNHVMSVMEYIQPDQNGFIAPSGDVGAFRQVLQDVVDHRDHLPCWARMARATIETSYNVEDDAERFVQFMKRVC